MSIKRLIWLMGVFVIVLAGCGRTRHAGRDIALCCTAAAGCDYAAYRGLTRRGTDE